MTRVAAIVLGCALFAFGAHPARAEQCNPIQCRQFDFFVGNWLVKDRRGQVVGTVNVFKTGGGCTLIEEWRGVGAVPEGLAAIEYQPAQRTWRRDALLRSSTILAFKGRLTGNSMVMTAREYPSYGAGTLHRITWTPRSDGSIEEVWQISTDAGKSWLIRYDEILTRIAE